MCRCYCQDKVKQNYVNRDYKRIGLLTAKEMQEFKEIIEKLSKEVDWNNLREKIILCKTNENLND